MTKRWKTGMVTWFVLILGSSAPGANVCQGNPNIYGGYGVVDLDDILWILQAFTGDPCPYTAGDTDFPDPNCPEDICSNNCEGERSIDLDDIMAVLLAAGGAPWGSICGAIECPPDTNVCRPVADAGPDQHVEVLDLVELTSAGSHVGSWPCCPTVRWDLPGCFVGQWGLFYHRFKEPGIYTVRLTITDDSGLQDTDEVVVTVTTPDQPVFHAIIRPAWVTVDEFPPTAECPDGYRATTKNRREPGTEGWPLHPAAEPGDDDD